MQNRWSLYDGRAIQANMVNIALPQGVELTAYG